MVKNILKYVLLVVLLAATGFGSYKAVIAIWGEKKITAVTSQPEGTGSTEKPQKNVKNMLVTAYYYDDYTRGVIDYAAVRFLNMNTKECNYLFFPGNSKIHLSDATYQTLHTACSKIEQETYLKKIATCFAQDSDRYQYTTLAIEDALGTKVDCYEAITSDNVIRIVNLIDAVSFDVPKKMSFKDDSNINIVLKKGQQTLLGDQVKGMLTKPELYSSETDRLECSENYVKAYMTELILKKDRDYLDDYYRQYYSLVESNTSYSAMLPYLSYMYDLKPANIVMTSVPAEKDKDNYYLDTEELAKIVKTYLASTASSDTEETTTEASSTTEETTTAKDATTEEESTTEETTTEEATTEEATTEEKDSDKVKDSKKLRVEIYNSTTINGLAAKWKTRIEKDGYKISATETERRYHLKKCVIYVSKKGLGEDLLEYFPDAEIKVGVLPKADVRIVLGTDDAKVR